MRLYQFLQVLCQLRSDALKLSWGQGGYRNWGWRGIRRCL